MPDTHKAQTVVTTDAFLRRQLQWLLLSRVVLLSLLLGLNVLLQSIEHRFVLPPLSYIAYFIAGVYAFTISSALLLKHNRNLENFALAQILTDIILTTLLILFTGVSQSIFTFIYFFPIISSGILLFRLQSMLIASVCTLTYGAILLFEYFDMFPELIIDHENRINNFMDVLQQFATPGLTFFFCVFLSTMLSERLRHTEAALTETSLNLDRLSLLYKQIFDDINTGIITVDDLGRITSFNRAAELITEYDRNEIIGALMKDQFPGLEQVTHKILRPMLNLTRKNGETIPIGYSWAILNMPDPGENNIVYTFQDLSQIKKMEDQVRQAEKMAGIGEMAAGIAHEFRNPLAAISGSSQILYKESINPQNQRLLNIIVRECDRFERTIENFLQFSRPPAPEKSWFQMREIIQETVMLLEQNPSWNSRCRILYTGASDITCWADRSQFQQVLLNLVNNSCIAMDEQGGIVQIEAREEKSEEGNSLMMITVADTGPGIPENALGKIFEPFFTTREQGTGLGLAIVWQIIDSHGGAIRFQNQPKGGVLATLTLPLP